MKPKNKKQGKLGILDQGNFIYDYDKKLYQRYIPLELLIYDTETDQLEIVSEDPNYFDFFWVPKDQKKVLK